jgi:hypothetical protein
VSKHDEDAFERLCASQRDRIKKFRRQYPDLSSVIEMALSAGHLIVGAIGDISNMTITESHRWMMWQTLFQYQQQSLLLIITANTDAGLALIRLASELSRDVAVIGDAEHRRLLWLKRRDPVSQHEYRKLFRFDDSTVPGAMAHQAYDLCSDYGVHGHVNDTIHMDPVGTFSRRGGDQLVILKATDTGALGALQIWLAAIAPLHLLCLETFVKKHDSILSEPYRLFMQAAELIGPVLKAITVRLHELGVSRPN